MASVYSRASQPPGKGQPGDAGCVRTQDGEKGGRVGQARCSEPVLEEEQTIITIITIIIAILIIAAVVAVTGGNRYELWCCRQAHLPQDGWPAGTRQKELPEAP